MYLPLLLTTVLKSSECIQILESWANLVVSETSAFGYVTFYFATPQKHFIPVSSSSSLDNAFFVTASDCADVIRGTNGLPSLSSCVFSEHTALFRFGSQLEDDRVYSVTLRVIQPSVRFPLESGARSSYFVALLNETTVIAETASPVELGSYVELSAEKYPTPDNARIIEFGLVSQSSLDVNASSSVMIFSVSSVGTLDRRYAIDVIASPEEIWNLGVVGSACLGYDQLRVIPGSSCMFLAFDGGHGNANGFRIQIGDTPMIENSNMLFKVVVKNAPVATNSAWTAISRRVTGSDTNKYPKSVLLSSPVLLTGVPRGAVISASFPAVNQVQSVTLRFFPGNTLIPTRQAIGDMSNSHAVAGTITIYPPSGFQVVASRGSSKQVSGFNAAFAEWTVDVENNKWILTISKSTLFADTEYGVELFVKNPSSPQPAFAWSILVHDNNGVEIASTRAIRGIETYGLLASLTVAHQTQLFDAKFNSIRVAVITSQPLSGESWIVMTFPVGFYFSTTCRQFRPVSPSALACVGSGTNWVKLLMPRGSIIRAGERVSIEVIVGNPSTLSDGDIVVTTFASDGSGIDTGKVSCFPLFPSELVDLSVTPLNRTAGIQTVVVRMRFPSLVPLFDQIALKAPSGVLWAAGPISTNHSQTNSTSFDAAVLQRRQNIIVLKIVNQTLLANVEYGIAARVTVPAQTPVINTWWVEQTRLAVGVASKPATGFETLSIVSISVVPYDTAAESFQNPVLFVFTTTSDAPSLRIMAPTGFRFVCPAKPFFPAESGINYAVAANVDSFISLPAHSCSVTVNNIVDLVAPGGLLKAKTTYAVVIPMINPVSVHPTTNTFSIASRKGSWVVEQGTVAGFSLATKMTNSQYLPSLGRENRGAEVTGNVVTLLAGITYPVPIGSFFFITAPRGMSLCLSGECSVAPAIYLGAKYSMFPSLSNLVCTCSDSAANVARVKLLQPLVAGNIYALTVTLKNSPATPIWNFWQLKISDPTGVVVQSEVWIAGFPIQEIKDVSIEPLNTGNAIPGESALNPLNITFTTSSAVPEAASDRSGGIVEFLAPNGFTAPSADCPVFSSPNAILAAAACRGDSHRTISLSTPAGSILPPGRYSVLVSFENPYLPQIIPENWAIYTRSTAGDTIDSNTHISGFPVNQRVKLFQVSASSATGLNSTDITIKFALVGRVLPSQKILVTAPSGFQLGESSCNSQLPSFMRCSVTSNSTVVATNTDPIRFGRSLQNSTSYSLTIYGVRNPRSTPALNIWRIAAETDIEYSPETWAVSGFAIEPQLESVNITSSNPGIGLFTDFTFRFRTASSIDSGGRIYVRAPADGFYFGPSLDESVVDLLTSQPHPSGYPVNKRPTIRMRCELFVDAADLQEWSPCPLQFKPCLISPEGAACVRYMELCRGANFHSRDIFTGTSEIFYCSSLGETLTLQTGNDVILPGGATLVFSVTGYNANVAPLQGAQWTVETRNSYSGAKPVDQASLAAFPLYGVVFVDSLIPSSTKVSSSNNQVQLKLKLARALTAPARIDIFFPSVFAQNVQMIMNVRTGGALPVTTSWKLDGSTKIKIECPNDPVPAAVTLELSLVLANPPVSPPEALNVWQILAYSGNQLMNVNKGISGFRVFAEFETCALSARVLAPRMVNTVGVSFSLASDLVREITNPSSYLHIVFPPGYAAVDSVCGQDQFSTEYTRYDGADSQFSPEKSFVQIPGGSICASQINTEGRLAISITLDSHLLFGIEYAFQVGVVNPPHTPVENSFLFKTLLDGVVLHLRKGVRGLVMEELDRVEILPSVPTRNSRSNRIQFSIQSLKNIPAASQILITGPSGFVLRCDGVSFGGGIQNSTKCTASGSSATLELDKTNPIQKKTEIQIGILCTNPPMTPQKNVWSVEIRNPDKITIDVRTDIPGFDVPGLISGYVSAQFVYTNQRSVATVHFTPSTVQTRANEGNELIVQAPLGYIFGTECRSLSLKAISSSIPSYPVPPSHVFPNLDCEGFNNETLLVRFPKGSGLGRFDYELTVLVVNAKSASQASDWTVFTRARDIITANVHTVDLNSTIPGYALAELSRYSQIFRENTVNTSSDGIIYKLNPCFLRPTSSSSSVRSLRCASLRECA